MKDIFSRRLKQARLKEGFSMDKLSENMGKLISKNSIKKYEKGEMMPCSAVLIEFANVLNVSIDYFFRPFKLDISKFEFRKKSSLTQKDTKKIEQTVIDYIERYLELEELTNEGQTFQNPINNIDILGVEDIESASVKLRYQWNLGDSPIQSVIDVMEYHNIKVIEIDAPQKFDGLSGYVNETIPVIVLNKSFPVERKRFTALHELGHLILNINESFKQKDIERFCNRLASAILLPISVINSRIGAKRSHITLEELEEIQCKYGVSIDAIMYRLKDLKVVTESRYKNYCISKNTNQKLKEFAKKSRFRNMEQTNRFDRLLDKALGESLITKSKASSLSMRSIDLLNESINYV